MRSQTGDNRGCRVTRFAGVCLGVLIAMISLTVNAAGFEDMLDDLRWQSRVLLVFTTEGEDPRAAEFFKAADANRCELLERDLVLGHINPAGRSYLGDSALDQAEAAAVREDFRVDDGFRILLIGKDGGVKANYRDVPELDEVFRLIDGMPMRRREARGQSEGCTD